MEGEEAEELTTWCRETVPKVFRIVSTRLPQRELVSLLLVSPWIYRTLASYPSLWLAIDFRERSNAGNLLISALSLPRYQHVKQVNLEFAQDIEEKHLELVKSKCSSTLQNLESLNLNGCQKISDKGIEAITSVCPKLKVFSIYWNVRCVKLTDSGLQQILLSCSSLQSLNLYALSSLSDDTYKSISLLSHLKFLDLCGAQNLSDEGVFSIAKCHSLVSLNLTWCIRVTDAGVIAIAEGCTSLDFLSLFGIVGVSDKCLEALSRSCSDKLTTLDVNGCIGIKILF
ncbi:hypothetical protein G4B88_012209 [Cannabis sativa]|uniref:F-box/LRR-repeat protein 15-like leucin rich repeat domain-containing protein n=1 Tax=Cannabis sativa TaxID=3483 RepID=A0A7J6I4A7_CANSA|nr:hypothetical protein G4B88_012209 [Cannabis sativa]